MGGRARLDVQPLTPAQQALVEANRGLVHQQAWQMAGTVLAAKGYRWNARSVILRNQLYDELQDAGMIGLCVAASLFDPERGVKFCTYAYPWIRNHVQRATHHCEVRICRRVNGHGQSTIQTAMPFTDLHNEMSPEELRAAEDFPAILPRKQKPPPREELTPRLQKCLRRILNMREYRLLRGYVLAGGTLKSVGLKEKITKERVRQILAKALVKLREDAATMKELLEELEEQARPEDDGDGAAVAIA